MGRLFLSSTAALISILAIPAFNRPTAALTSAEAIDSANAYPNVGVIMVWRDANNPLTQRGWRSMLWRAEAAAAADSASLRSYSCRND